MLLVIIQSLFARVQTDALQAARENADELGTARDQLQFRTEELDRYGAKKDTPFEYQFESDGDLDITIAGKTYDIDSPYDIDKPKMRKKKTSKKRTKKRR